MGRRAFQADPRGDDGDIVLYTSPVLLAELQDVLERKHLAERLSSHRSSARQAVRLYAELAIAVSPLDTPRVVPADRDDDHVVAAAVAGKVDLIVSGDRHLLSMIRHEAIAIVSARDALTRIASASP